MCLRAKKIKAARIIKFLDANMKRYVDGATREFISRRDLSRRLAASNVTATDCLAGNFTEQPR